MCTSCSGLAPLCSRLHQKAPRVVLVHQTPLADCFDLKRQLFLHVNQFELRGSLPLRLVKTLIARCTPANPTLTDTQSPAKLNKACAMGRIDPAVCIFASLFVFSKRCPEWDNVCRLSHACACRRRESGLHPRGIPYSAAGIIFYNVTAAIRSIQKSDSPEDSNSPPSISPKAGAEAVQNKSKNANGSVSGSRVACNPNNKNETNAQGGDDVASELNINDTARAQDGITASESFTSPTFLTSLTPRLASAVQK
ncbi:LOW QUALITY PROTEIN: hypothetical protein ColTof3_14736 [Colletotrichum tofieldiae]|nr:LOW QUALITY PROTEIN: hypothetical protein ColTof3_14736 [Colletotrichum tofieldiae]